MGRKGKTFLTHMQLFPAKIHQRAWHTMVLIRTGGGSHFGPDLDSALDMIKRGPNSFKTTAATSLFRAVMKPKRNYLLGLFAPFSHPLDWLCNRSSNVVASRRMNHCVQWLGWPCLQGWLSHSEKAGGWKERQRTVQHSTGSKYRPSS